MAINLGNVNISLRQFQEISTERHWKMHLL